MENQSLEKLLQIFTNRWNWIINEGQSWKTVKTCVSDSTLIRIYEDPSKIIGLGFGQHTQYLMLDIDKNSPYHPKNDPNGIPLLELTLYKIGLTENIKIQSSHSKGIHIYYPFPHQLKSYKVGAKITECLEDNGWTVKNGVLEVFPNKKKDNLTQDKSQWKLYQRHRLPLQPESGSYLLNNDYQPITDHPDPLESFLEQWETIAQNQNIKKFKQYLYVGKKKSKALTQIERELNQLISKGFTGHGQTNHILLTLGRQIRLCRQLGGVELRDTIIHTITHMKGYEEYCGHQYEIYQRCQDIARWAEKTFPLLSERKSQNLPKPKTNNHIKARDALDRIIEAVTIAIQQEYETLTAFIKQVCQIAHCSAKTLYKHQRLWREKVKLKIVCNSTQAETLSLVEVAEKEQQQTSPKAIQHKALQQPEQKPTEQQQIACNSRQREASSLDLVDRYILRFYILSCALGESKIKENKQNSAVGRSSGSCAVMEKPEVVVNPRAVSENETIIGEVVKPNGGELEVLESQSSSSGVQPLGMMLERFKAQLALKARKTAQEQDNGDGITNSATAQKSPDVPPQSDNSGNDGDKLTQERSKFLNGLGIEIPEKLAELVNQATMEQLNNLRQLLKENKTLNNPVGFLIKALTNNWQPKQKPTTPSKPSWQEEFEEFYHQAIKAGYCEDLPMNWLTTNHRREPMVRVNKPDSWTKAPYTLVYWRDAMQEFWESSG